MWRKRIWSSLLVLVLMFCLMSPQTVLAKEQISEIPQSETPLWIGIEQDPAELMPEASSVNLYAPTSQNTEWAKYATSYYYNKMDSRKQALYDAFDALCYSYLTTQEDGIEVTGYPSSSMSYLRHTDYGLTEDEALNVLLIFRFSNPQYYFINEYYWIGSGNIALGMYPEFRVGTVRETSTQNLKAKIDSYVTDISSKSNAAQKEKRAHDLVVQNGSYDVDAAYNQSCYSLFMNENGATVCAGYAQAFALLCNAVELDTICVTSTTHEWNQIKLDGQWYHVDCTWNDTANTNYYYNLTTQQMLEADQANAHKEVTSLWLGYLPDYEIAPTLSITYSEGSTYISISSAKNGGTIYYTTNGTTPTTASNVYSEPIYITSAKTVKAVTVYNGITSNIVSQTIGVNNPSGQGYHAVFDAAYYLNRYQDLKRAYGMDVNKAYEHFVNYGMSEGRQGIATFDVYSYRNQYADLRRGFGNNLKAYYEHYQKYGRFEGRKGTGCITLQGATTVYNGIDYSAVYDYNYYIARYGDIKNAYQGDENAVIAHFVNYGMNEGRQGIATFDVYSYRNQYADLRKGFGNYLRYYYQHYMNYGMNEGRQGTGCATLQGATTIYNGVNYGAVYDYNYYVARYGDIRNAYAGDENAVIAHFVNHGMSEGRQGNSQFNVSVYKHRYTDLQRGFGNNLKAYYMHYINYGKTEGRSGK